METTTDTRAPTATAADTLLLTLDGAELGCARRSIGRHIAGHRRQVGRSVRVERREFERFIVQMLEHRGRTPKNAEQTTSTLYGGADGYRHARVDSGRAPDGTTDRRYGRKTKGLQPDPGRPDPGRLARAWLDAVLPMTVRWKTLSTYRSQTRKPRHPGSRQLVK